MFITLQCHYPLFVHGCVKHEFPQDVGRAISKLFSFVLWIMSKEIHVASIPWWRQEIVEIVCIFEKELPTSFMDLQVHILIHLVDEVELVGVFSCLWMFFLERYMKKLKGFIRQREKPEGSIAEGYISYESFYYASEYIKKIKNRPGVVIWDNERDEDKREGELLQTNGKRCLIKSKRLMISQIYTK